MFPIFYRPFLSLFLISLFLPAVFAPVSVSQALSIRPADEVMQLQVSRDEAQALQLQWIIAPKVYMYRDKIEVEKLDNTLVAVDVTAGIVKQDINFGSTEVLYNRAFAQIAADALPKDGHLLIRWQGCEEDSICYPPVTKSLDLQTLEISNSASGPVSGYSAQKPVPVAETSNSSAGEEDVSALLASNFNVMLVAFFGFGLLLSLTPCVFPMIPILSAMLARSGDKLSARRGFVLSSAYVVAMALAYAVLGFAASWSGYNLQAALQTPYALGFMALIFVFLAFSMFGYYELQLPSSWTSSFSSRPSAGGRNSAITGALLLGFGSALIVGPCVTPPLAAALLYVAKTGDAIRGASALFALGLGMGMPLIIFGTFGAKFLPKSGPWLNYIKQIFGVVFLGLAIYMVLRLLSDENAMLLLSITALAVAVFLGVLDRSPQTRVPLMQIKKTVGIVALIYGALLMVGFAGGSTNPWQPLGFLQGNTAQVSHDAAGQSVKTVKTSAEYDQALKTALAAGKPVMVKFTADWCTICKTNDKLLQKPEFADRLSNLTTIQADITDYNDQSRNLMQRFNVVGPPTMMFLEAHTGTELSKKRIIGEVTPLKLEDRLQSLGV